MTIPLNPLRSKFQTVCLRCKQKWHDIQEKLQRLLSPLTHDEAEPWPPLEELTLTPMEEEGTTLAAAHWPLDDKNHVVEQKNMVIVEVKYFPKDAYEGKNLKLETEDPNLRITHYPPSNRLH